MMVTSIFNASSWKNIKLHEAMPQGIFSGPNAQSHKRRNSFKELPKKKRRSFKVIRISRKNINGTNFRQTTHLMHGNNKNSPGCEITNAVKSSGKMFLFVYRSCSNIDWSRAQEEGRKKVIFPHYILLILTELGAQTVWVAVTSYQQFSAQKTFSEVLVLHAMILNFFASFSVHRAAYEFMSLAVMKRA